MARYTTFFREHILQPTDNLAAVGLAYHLADLVLPELRAVAGDKRLPERAVLALLEPFMAALQAVETPMAMRIR